MSDTLKEILEFDLFAVGGYSLTVYHLVRVLIILAAARTFLWLTKKGLNHGKFKNLDSGNRYALLQIITYFVWILVIVAALESIGVRVTILVAGSAALLVGIGLGLQQTFNDIFSGLILLIEGSIKVDDILKVGDEVVKVKKIGLRTSIVEDRNQMTLIMPNSKIVTDTVINWSHTVKQSRFKISVGVSYGTDVDLVCEILKESVKEHPSNTKEREPIARLVNFGDSSLDFEVHFWTSKMFEVEQSKSDIRKSIVKKFQEGGVVIPFPQRDIHFKSSDVQLLDSEDN